VGSVQFAKWRRDLRSYQGRVAAMFAALAASLVGLGAVLDGYSILQREVSLSYLSGRPAHATFDLGAVEDSLVAEISRLPYVAAAEARTTVNARIRGRGGQWIPLRLFVIRDFNAMTLSSFQPENGAWPPPDGSLLVERSSKEVWPFAIGDAAQVVMGNGPVADLTISGSVHDTGLAPAWQEQTVWGYCTPATLQVLGGPVVPQEAKVLFNVDPRNGKAILGRTRELAAWLTSRGIPIHGIQVPPAGLHPHQGQMDSVVTLFLVFGLLVLASSAILSAALLGGLLEKETRAVGIMKTLGAGPGRIMAQYMALVAVPVLAALVVAMPTGLALGRALSTSVEGMLNLGTIDTRVTLVPVAALVGAGILVPFAFCLVPLARRVSQPIQRALAFNGGVRAVRTVRRDVGAVSRAVGMRARWLVLATRNLFRKRARLALTLGLLGTAGMLFLATSNIVAAQRAAIESTLKERLFDYELRLGSDLDIHGVVSALGSVPGIARVEPWPTLAVMKPAEDGMPLSRVYPDGGHGSLWLRGVPPASSMAAQKPVAGRGLTGIPRGGVVMNRAAWAGYGQPAIDTAVNFYLDGAPVKLLLVGVVPEIGPAALYTSQEDLERIVGRAGVSNDFRLRTTDAGGMLTAREQARVEEVLRGFGASVSLAFSETTFRAAISGHSETLTFSLYFLSVLLGIVGLLGLSSTLGSSVAERQREFGVMRTVGATPAVIRRTVLVEALGLAWLSLELAVVMSLPLSAILGSFLGRLSFRQPYSLTISGGFLLLWFLASTAASVVAALGPAGTAARLSVKETLAYE
jgi:putative ABC transport system permease protein